MYVCMYHKGFDAARTKDVTTIVLQSNPIFTIYTFALGIASTLSVLGSRSTSSLPVRCMESRRKQSHES